MRKIIEEATLELLQNCPFEKVTVRQICREAAVSKNSFYRNFRDKYHVVHTFIEEELIDRTGSESMITERGLLAFFELMEEHPLVFERIFLYQGPDSFEEYYQKKLTRELLEKDGDSGSYWKASFIAAGVTGMIRNWISKGYKPRAVNIVSEIWETFDGKK